MKPKIAVVGANGFIGRHLVQECLRRGYPVRSIVRTSGTAPAGSEEIALGDFTEVTDWSPALAGTDVVVHLAARVHVMKDTAADPLEEFRRMNVEITEKLARGAAANQVKSFVFLSTIGVLGSTGRLGHAFQVEDVPAPDSEYAQSKFEAEQALRRMYDETGLNVAIIRPPLVYGPNAPGNILRLLKLIDSGVPLPFGRVANRRSMVSVSNLVDNLIYTIDARPRGVVVELVADKEELSTPELIQVLATGMKRKVRLVPVPVTILGWLFRLVGRSREAEQLLGSLRVNTSSTYDSFSWSPPFSTHDRLEETAMWYRDRGGRLE